MRRSKFILITNRSRSRASNLSLFSFFWPEIAKAITTVQGNLCFRPPKTRFAESTRQTHSPEMRNVLKSASSTLDFWRRHLVMTIPRWWRGIGLWFTFTLRYIFDSSKWAGQRWRTAHMRHFLRDSARWDSHSDSDSASVSDPDIQVQGLSCAAFSNGRQWNHAADKFAFL